MAELTKEKLFEDIKNIFKKVDPKVEGIDLNSNLENLLSKINSQLGADIDKLIKIVPKEIQGDISSKLNELSSSSSLDVTKLQTDLIPFIQEESQKTIEFMKNPANLLKTGLKGLSALSSGTSPTEIFDKMNNIVNEEVKNITDKYPGKDLTEIQTAFSSVLPISSISSISEAAATQLSTLPTNDGTPLSQDDDQGIVNKILNKIKNTDITVMSIYLYLTIIFGLYFFVGFIFTNCIADGAKDVYYQIIGIKFTTWSNIVNDISNMYSIATSKPPTTRNAQANSNSRNR